jgi:hypothetical protein
LNRLLRRRQRFCGPARSVEVSFSSSLRVRNNDALESRSPVQGHRPPPPAHDSCCTFCSRLHPTLNLISVLLQEALVDVGVAIVERVMEGEPDAAGMDVDVEGVVGMAGVESASRSSLPLFAGRFSVPILDLRCLVLGTVVIEGWANVYRPLHCFVAACKIRSPYTAASVDDNALEFSSRRRDNRVRKVGAEGLVLRLRLVHRLPAESNLRKQSQRLSTSRMRRKRTGRARENLRSSLYGSLFSFSQSTTALFSTSTASTKLSRVEG